MFKILYMTDSHTKGISPRNRLDNFHESIQAKLIEIWKIAKQQKVDIILHGGDVFDSYLVSNTLSDWFIDLVEKNKIPLYVVPGNHGEFCNNWELSNATTLAHMFRRSKYINQLTEFENDDVYIKGQNYYVGIEENLNKEFPQHNKKDKLTIYVPHAMIVNVPVWYTSCVYYKNVDTNYDIVAVSHNHRYWGIQEHNNTKFVAPGGVARIAADEFDIDRHPAIAIIDTKTKDVEIIQLKSAKPVDEIFDLEKLAVEKENKNKLEAFTAGLKNIKIKTMKVMDVVLDVCKKSEVDDSVKNNLRERISLNEDSK